MSSKAELSAQYYPDFVERKNGYITLNEMKEKLEVYSQEIIDYLENYDSEVNGLEEIITDLQDENSELKDRVVELEKENEELKTQIDNLT